MKLYFILLFFLSLNTLFGQQSNDSLTSINKSFQSFEFEKVIARADSMLTNKDSISQNLQIELYRLKGISQYSLLQNNPAKNSFMEILKIDSGYVLDSSEVSPKIIDFYNDVRSEYISSLHKAEIKPAVDTVYVSKYYPDPASESNVKSAILRSLILPGWGHLYKGESVKGWILTSVSAISLASSVFLIFNTNSKYDEYINETDINSIPVKYDNYNSSYKLRNYSLIAFAAAWIYAQLDLLIFSSSGDSRENANNSSSHIEILPESGLRLSYRVTF